jgi:tRNA dimethylallyltransferase
MFAAGFVDEVRGLLERFGQLSRTASQAVGYREVIDHLCGASDLPTTIEAVKTRTRRFARRQETWFRSLSECRFVSRTPEEFERDVAARLARL